MLPRIRSIQLLSQPQSDRAGVSVGIEDGSLSTFEIATPSAPARILNEPGGDFSCGAPVLFVRRIDQETVGEAIEAMAADIGGFWLRYYNSAPPAPAKKIKGKPRKK